ncbi:MAG: zinc ribbon domain-containing protein [Bacteroidota bacterium]|nr:zinc ribbon domain-containing protein [Bacteroidota bacterium]
MNTHNYKCPKCSNRQYEVDEFRATGSFLTKIFDIQNKRFTTVTCTKCKYTEIYKVPSNKIGNVLDFFTG